MTKDSRKDWRLWLWHRLSGVPHLLLRLADWTYHKNSELHTSWREKYRCTATNEAGERCVYIPGIGGCGQYLNSLKGKVTPHFFWSEIPDKESDNGRPFHLEAASPLRGGKIPYFSWIDRRFVPVQVKFDDGSRRGERVVAWALEEDVKFVVQDVEMK